jgi:Flp pilus assembly protein TadB
MRATTKRFWDVYIGAAVLITLGNILELPPGVAILAYLACASAFLLAIGNFRADR